MAGEIQEMLGMLAPSSKLSDLFTPQSFLMGGDNPILQADAEATPNNINYAIMQGAKYLPKQESSGPEGGWFGGPWKGEGGFLAEIPNMIVNQRENYTRGTDPGWAASGGPPQGLRDPSTNNWRLLPRGYNNPNWIMRNGEIIDRRILGNPGAWNSWGGISPQFGEGSRTTGPYPLNITHSYAGHAGDLSGGWPGSVLGLHNMNQGGQTWV